MNFRHIASYLLLAGVVTLPDVASSQALITDEPVPLQALRVDARLTGHDAVTVEHRTYRPPTTFRDFGRTDASSEPTPARFYRPVPVGTEVVSLSHGGAPLEYEVLPAPQADVLRLALAAEHRDPVFVRDQGRALLVSAPLLVETGAFVPSVQLTLELRSDHTRHGTLRGPSIPVDWHRDPVGSLDVDVHAQTEAPLRALYAPYHTLDVTRHGAHEATARYRGWQRCTAFEVTVLMSTGTAPIHLDLLAHRDQTQDDGTFVALLSTSAEAVASTARDIVLVVDRSGSMDGEKMDQARAALASVLDRLTPEDHVGLVTFDTTVESLSDEAQPASAAHLQSARAFVGDLTADGGTNIYDALEQAFDALPLHTGRPRYVVLLTDGVPTEGETDTDAILAMAKARGELGARIFTFGIGHDVNTVLLDRLAMDSAGDALYVPPGQPVDDAVTAFFEQIAAPVLTTPTLDVSDLTSAGADATYPAVMNDLFASQTIAVAGRYHGGGPGRMRLSGSVGGQSRTFDFDVVMPDHVTDNGFVPRVWARRRVAELLQRIKLGDDDPALEAEALTLAQRYGVITEFTWFEWTKSGDMVMAWGGVPDDEVGSTAVETSASIDSYGKGYGVDATTDAFVRYDSDRTFPLVAGWYTDTAWDPAGGSDVVDLHFLSPAWLALLDAERILGLPGRFGTGANTRFVHGGRSFRVTDPLAKPKGHDLPPESAYVPAFDEGQTPALPATTTATWVAPPSTTEAQASGQTPTPTTAGAEPAVAPNPAVGTVPSQVLSASPVGPGCTQSSHSSGGGIPTLLLLGLVALGWRSIRAHATRTV